MNQIPAMLLRHFWRGTYRIVEVSPNRCRFCINPLPESQDESSSNILRRINPDYITVQDSLQPMQIKPALPLAIRMIPAWINNLRSQLVLLSVAANDRNGRTPRRQLQLS